MTCPTNQNLSQVICIALVASVTFGHIVIVASIEAMRVIRKCWDNRHRLGRFAEIRGQIMFRLLGTSMARRLRLREPNPNHTRAITASMTSVNRCRGAGNLRDNCKR